jgi:hypothetical protein
MQNFNSILTKNLFLYRILPKQPRFIRNKHAFPGHQHAENQNNLQYESKTLYPALLFCLLSACKVIYVPFPVPERGRTPYRYPCDQRRDRDRDCDYDDDGHRHHHQDGGWKKKKRSIIQDGKMTKPSGFFHPEGLFFCDFYPYGTCASSRFFTVI